jgi:sugar O-acyltransferase (sialic acid O-acetyltransferase NeuD family)
MKDIIIIGSGGHAAEIDDYIGAINERISSFNIVGFIDDNPESYKMYKFSAKYLGDIRSHNIQPDCYYVMGIANLLYRKPIIEKFLSNKAKFCTLIHPSAYISRSAAIGHGVVIAPNVNVGPNARVGDYTLLNARCSIGHDTSIGKHNFISPNVSFSGFTTVGDENLFGVNSATIPGIKVGNRNKIAAGMVLDKPINDDAIVFHRFKEKVIFNNGSQAG